MPIESVRGLYDDPDGFDSGWWKRGAELGWTSFLIPEALGGGSLSGDGPVDLAIIAEELGRTLAPGPLLPTNVVAETIGRSGSATQQALLADVVAGELILAWAFCEPEGSWSPDDVQLTATGTADGYSLMGTKTAVEAGAQADHILVSARTPEGLTQFLIPASTPGLVVTPQESLDLGRRFAAIRFDSIEVSAETVVGTVGGAAADIDRQLMMAMMIQSFDSAGAAARVFEFTVEYAFDRYSFGRPLASYQALKHRFADMKLWLEAGHAVSDGAADALADGVETAHRVLAASAWVGDHAVEIMHDCVQMHGGIGVTWEHDIHLYLRRATVNRGLFGTPTELRDRLGAVLDA